MLTACLAGPDNRTMKFLLALICAAVCAGFAGGAAVADEPCKLTPIGSAEVLAVRDGRTLLLKDGRELRLAAIEVTGASRAALAAAIAAGRPLRLEKLNEDHDRYGRLVAFAFAGKARTSLQQTLLEQGQARVSARIGDKSCALALLAAEKRAREARSGQWTDPNFAPLRSENVLQLKAERGRFVLVEGKVLSVRESGATIYVNFGRRWTRDFTITILRRHARAFAAAGLEPKTLEGRRVRVRGYVEQRAGPIIEATAPEQIELAD